ncbi:Uncharacterised protein [uncultured archaeon]|nr:Uncharacterised protein [uncultured archaeon]
MYMIRPFPGRVNPNGEKEFAGFYCWFAHANQQYTRDYGAGKISFNNYGRTESDEDEETRRRKQGASAPVRYEEPARVSYSPASHSSEFSRHPPL